ncbi:sugar transferase [Paracoccus tegillarcae]|uniref:Sugar transferase n=1 Tax=Paracoccus tegillarcae TaxID=1529068 RepID=A0A2K9EJG1_9RHOB|nr:sugar transferase [Paracoccus tegillarcae]AUH35158.1 sugar transferase [Paracoccus tegillarcae]
MPLSKRLFDIVFATLLLLPVLLLMGGVALALLITQGRPIIYSARRMSGLKQSFTLWKFRTMSVEESDYGVTGPHKNARITRFGHFLRRTRIDELPQLFNILKGDMSFVGPRPPNREHVEQYPTVYAQVLKSRPGVTGLATLIYHRHEGRILSSCSSAEATEFVYRRRCLPAKLRLDLIYQRHRSIMMDVWIMWQTVRIVTVGVGRRRRRLRRQQQSDV